VLIGVRNDLLQALEDAPAMEGSSRMFHAEEEQLISRLYASRFLPRLPWERRGMMPLAFVLVYTSALVVLILLGL
jgi:hypothetical protein